MVFPGHARLLLLSASFSLVACVFEDEFRPDPPATTSPELVALAESVKEARFDRLRDDAVWLAESPDRLLQLRGGRVQPLEISFAELGRSRPEFPVVRVFADGAVALDTLYGKIDADLPLSGGGSLHFSYIWSIDGLSLQDYWLDGRYVRVDASGASSAEETGLCHVVAGEVEHCAEASDGRIAVAADGSVFVTGGTVSTELYRYAEGKLTRILSSDGANLIHFRRSGTSLYLSNSNHEMYALEGSKARLLDHPGQHVVDVLGDPSDYYYAQADAQWYQPDPLYGYYPLWTQLVIWHVKDGVTTEVAHTTCIDRDGSIGCPIWEEAVLGFDGATVAVLADPILVVPTP